MKRILFVDDEPKILNGVRRMLYENRDSWDMQFAPNAEAALQACEAGSFDVVITDMMMPGMNGATLLGHIRDRYPSTARVILSGYIEGALGTRALSVAHRFLVKPCSELELRSTIERLCALEDLVSSQEIRRIVGMSSKVLQLCNSAFFGLSQTIVNLPSAVAYLGMETVKNLALTFEAFRVFEGSSCIPPSIYDSIQRHSVETAAIASALPVKRAIREVTVAAALLHDIGSLFLASKMPNEFRSVLTLARESGRQPFQVEEELLGTSHAEIGAYLLRLWGIPNLAVEAIAHHHHPTRVPHTDFDSSVAVYVADLLAHELEAHPEGSKGLQIAEDDRLCLDALGILPSFDEFRELAMQSHSRNRTALVAS